MSFEPCSDIRFKLHAERLAKGEIQPHEKENNAPAGVVAGATSYRGRGRGLLCMRERMRERKKQTEREYLFKKCFDLLKTIY